MEKKNLTTASLRLVPPSATDATAVTAACQDPEIQRWVPIPVPYTEADGILYASAQCDDSWADGTAAIWTIRSGDVFAGIVGLYRIGHGAADLGFWMVPDFRAKGLLTEACTAVLDFALAPAPAGMGLHRVGWNALAGNRGSARVAQKLGFRFEGTARLAAVGRDGLEDDWGAGLLAPDDRTVQPWSILA
ncbi:GNAT family N-acetyltransferase [Paeniglutamicibacter cryotolerans]|uniref:RimJ/RimL family protein N-acetyltransferase n=1 Tax=Paeniglutamicibacter cryotolerans TaxID=670079 RepID=A0A839QHH1_9MICC|nr:GNAT family N-acetyltransferase [Paeniglutamicibacter cryotolerans]MBB2995340.1 RimJ/RimL family protein N-acetyltransferase [Paeniglutamicibacter cryotolerans]